MNEIIYRLPIGMTCPFQIVYHLKHSYAYKGFYSLLLIGITLIVIRYTVIGLIFIIVSLLLKTICEMSINDEVVYFRKNIRAMTSLMLAKHFHRKQKQIVYEKKRKLSKSL